MQIADLLLDKLNAKGRGSGHRGGALVHDLPGREEAGAA